MIKVRKLSKLKKLSEDELTAHSWKEYSIAFNHVNNFMEQNPDVWEISYDGEVVFIAGIVRGSFIGRGAELWFLCFRSFIRGKVSLIKFLKRALDRIVKLYRRVFVTVSDGFAQGNAFVNLLGFKLVDKTLMADNTMSNVYVLKV